MLLPGLAVSVARFDISSHGIGDVRPEVRESLFIHQTQDEYPFPDGAFDLVISLGCLRNLRLPKLESAFPEIQRVGRDGYIMPESYRSNT